MERNKLLNTVLQNFVKALFESLKPFKTEEEKVGFLEVLIEYLRGTYSYEPPIPAIGMEGVPFDSDDFIRKNILLKYKQRAKSFVDTGLRYYFEKDQDLKQHLFARLKIEEPVLTEEEFENYIDFIYRLLHSLIENICIQPYEEAKAQTEKEVKNISEGSDDQIVGFKSQSKEYTRSRQILLFYFVLELIGKSKHKDSMKKLAEFGHVLFAWPTDNAVNAGVYRMLKDAPYLKENDKAMLKDLEFIKKQFENIEHEKGIALVQKEIDSIKKT
jgi:hypothetical protein